MDQIVYALCALMSLLCAGLLLLSYRRSGGKLLFWTGLCFLGLFLNNSLLFVDLVLTPQIDLLLSRHLSALAAVSALIFGLIWETV